MSTIRDVAKLAGVSTATVSRVINNDHTYKMRGETRDRVWEAVAKAGYKLPAPAGTAPVPKAGCNVGCVLSVTKDKYKDPYYTSVFSGVEEGLAARGMHMMFLKTYNELDDEAELKQIIADPPDGLILMETLRPKLYRQLRARVPHCIGVDTLHDDIDNVGYDQFETGMRITKFLLSRGHKKIAFVGGAPTDNLYENKRFQGYISALLAAGIQPNDSWIRHCQWDELLCIEQVKEIMAQPQRPTAVFAASDLMAIAALSALYSMGINVPGEVAVVGLSNIELSKFTSPPLTTYDIPTKQLGLMAVELLERRLNGDKMPPLRVNFPTKRIVRSSV